MTGNDRSKPRPLGWGFLFVHWLVCSLPCASPQGTGDTVLGIPLSIDGVVVPPAEIQAAICLGPFRERWLDIFRLEVVAEKERLRRGIEEPFRFLEERPFGFERGELQTWSGLAFVDTLRELFTPDDPADFPPATLACGATPQGQRMLMQVRMIHESRAAHPEQGLGAGEMQVRDLLLQMVLDSLTQGFVTTEGPAFLLEGVLMKLEDHELTLERLWPQIAGFVSPVDVTLAKKWVINQRVLEGAFTRAGVWFSADEERAREATFRSKFASGEAQRGEYGTYGFPALEPFLRYRLYNEAMFRLLRKEITPEVLADSFRERLALIEGSTVNVDLLLLSAYDFVGRTWKPDGWADSERRLKEVLRRLTQEGRGWVESMRESSEFPPSIGLSLRKQRRPSALRDDYPGSLRTHQYQDLMTILEENAYTRFLNGGSVTDLIFFELEVGAAGAPVAGSRGWMIPLLLERTEPARRLIRSRPDSSRNRGLLVTFRLIEYLGEAIAASDIRGF